MTTTCEKCGNKIEWLKEGKKWFCRNPDGTDHWDLCTQSINDHYKNNGSVYSQKIKKETEHGFMVAGVKRKFSTSGITIKGKGYRPVMHNGSCHALPWEECRCGK